MTAKKFEKRDGNTAWEYFKKNILRLDKSTSIQEGLLKLNTKLHVSESMFVRDRNRMSQFYTSFADGSTSIDFWENGMCWHSQFLYDKDKVSLAAYLWNDLRFNSDEIERQIPEIQFPIERKRIEISNQEYIKWHWQNLIHDTRFKSKNEVELIALLSNDKKVNKLMTFHQLEDFGLSRHIGAWGDNLKNDLLRTSLFDDQIIVRTEQQAIAHHSEGKFESVGKGSPQEAYAIIMDELPADIDWAEYQTLEQYEQRTT